MFSLRMCGMSIRQIVVEIAEIFVYPFLDFTSKVSQVFSKAGILQIGQISFTLCNHDSNRDNSVEFYRISKHPS